MTDRKPVKLARQIPPMGAFYRLPINMKSFAQMRQLAEHPSRVLLNTLPAGDGTVYRAWGALLASGYKIKCKACGVQHYVSSSPHGYHCTLCDAPYNCAITLYEMNHMLALWEPRRSKENRYKHNAYDAFLAIMHHKYDGVAPTSEKATTIVLEEAEVDYWQAAMKGENPEFDEFGFCHENEELKAAAE